MATLVLTVGTVAGATYQVAVGNLGKWEIPVNGDITYAFYNIVDAVSQIVLWDTLGIEYPGVNDLTGDGVPPGHIRLVAKPNRPTVVRLHVITI